MTCYRTAVVLRRSTRRDYWTRSCGLLSTKLYWKPCTCTVDPNRCTRPPWRTSNSWDPSSGPWRPTLWTGSTTRCRARTNLQGWVHRQSWGRIVVPPETAVDGFLLARVSVQRPPRVEWPAEPNVIRHRRRWPPNRNARAQPAGPLRRSARTASTYRRVTSTIGSIKKYTTALLQPMNNVTLIIHHRIYIIYLNNILYTERNYA